MNIGKAVAIFNDIHNEEIEVEDKINAIDEVSGMATHNGITKKKMVEVLRWLTEEYIQEVIQTYKNSEGYPDPTAGKALREADRMPTHIYNVYTVLNNTAGLLGLEITGIRDRKTKKEWKRRE